MSLSTPLLATYYAIFMPLPSIINDGGRGVDGGRETETTDGRSGNGSRRKETDRTIKKPVAPVKTGAQLFSVS